MYVAESEGAKFWLSVLTDLKNQGVEDILIACVDGLKGFPEAIEATEIQTCVIHQIRHTLRYIAEKDKKAFMQDLKLIYQAVNQEEGYYNLLTLEEKWGNRTAEAEVSSSCAVLDQKLGALIYFLCL